MSGISTHDCERTPSPVCPGCGHEFSPDDMLATNVDLFALAPDEGMESIECPACDARFWVQGGYKPHYTSSFSEDDL